MLARRMIIMLVAVALVFGGVIGFISFGHYMRDKFLASMGFPPQSVSTMPASIQDWQPQLEGVGSDMVQIIKGLVLLLAVALDVYNKSQGRFSIIGTLMRPFRRDEPAAPADSSGSASDPQKAPVAS